MTKQIKADLALLLVALVWGASFALMKQAINYILPYTFLAYRYLIAALILCAVFYKSLKNINAKTLRYGFLIGGVMFAGCALQIIGLKYTTASKSGFITGLNVIMVPLFIAIRYKKAPGISTILSTIIALSGLCMLSISSPFTINIGDVLTFFCAIFFALQVIFISKYSPMLDPFALTIVVLLTISLFSLIPAIFYEGMAADLNPSSIFALLFTAIFCSSLAYSLQMSVQKYTSATHAALIFIGEPVFSMIFSFIFLDERLSLRGAIGCVLVLAGMLISEFDSKAQAHGETV